jgi:hypothetical protein
MGLFVWYQPLDSLGMLALDLHKCCRFSLHVYDPMSLVDSGLAYYMHREDNGQIRWIRCIVDEEPVSDAAGSRMEVGESYEEVAPQQVVYDFSQTKWLMGRLPPELEAFREFSDPMKWFAWSHNDTQRRYEKQWGKSGQDQGPLEKRKPSWNGDSLTLFIDGEAYRQFRRLKGNDQIKILESFESARWPDCITNPFGDEFKLKETVKSFNKVSTTSPKSQKRFLLIAGRRRVCWELRSGGSYRPSSRNSPR